MKILILFVVISIFITIAFCDDSTKGGDDEVPNESHVPIVGPDEGSHVNYDHPIGPSDINGRNPYYDNWHPFDTRQFGPHVSCNYQYPQNGYPPFDRFDYERYPDWSQRLNRNNYYNQLDYERNPRFLDNRRFGDHNYGPNSYGYEYSLPGGGFTYFHRSDSHK